MNDIGIEPCHTETATLASGLIGGVFGGRKTVCRRRSLNLAFTFFFRDQQVLERVPAELARFFERVAPDAPLFRKVEGGG